METLVATWGSTAAERTLRFPCDRDLPDADDAFFRAVDVEAPAPVLFRWLCQLKVAPYSYDWIDNFGRQSPRHLVAGLEQLEVGQRFMGLLELVDFAADRHLTLRFRGSALLGDIAVTYLIIPERVDRCRLVVKLLLRYPRVLPFRPLVGWLVAAADLVMMRKQLLTLKRLAECQAGDA